MQAEEIVEGDTLHLTAGDVVPADATISTISTLGGGGGALLIGAGNRRNNVRNNKSKRGRVSKGCVCTVIWIYPALLYSRTTNTFCDCLCRPSRRCARLPWHPLLHSIAPNPSSSWVCPHGRQEVTWGTN